MIEDRGRVVNTHSSWDGPADIIQTVVGSYATDWWADQRCRSEVWLEKDFTHRPFEDVCTDLRVPYFATRGNNSQTMQYQAGKRFERFLDQGLKPVLLHLA